MSNNNSSSYIIDTDQSRLEMNSLFSSSNNQSKEVPKPYRKRNLPASFHQQPRLHNKSKNGDGQHIKSQLSLSDTSLYTRTDSNYVHSRAVSDTAALTGQSARNSTSSHMNSQALMLPLPDGWREERTSDGQVFYADRLTKTTTWIDPRPNHYAAFHSYCTTLPLPDGYEQKSDAKDNIYFIDHKSKQTYWDDPRPNHYRSLMTKRFDLPSSTASQPQEDLLANKLMKISKERHALQLRTQELERMEADIRKKLNEHGNTNNQSTTDETTIEALIDDLLLHRRHDSADSGLGDGTHSMNRTFDAFSDFPDDLLFPSSSDFSGFLIDTNLPVQDPHSTSIMNDSQLRNKSSKQPQQWSYNTHL